MRRAGNTRDLLSNLGSVVKERRQELGFSQEELAERSGLHRTYITDIERGVRNITLKSATKVADALELSLTSIFAKVERDHEFGSQEGLESLGILLVDNDPHQLEFMTNALKENGVVNPIFRAKTGGEALELMLGPSQADKPRPGVILIDLRLPDMNGFDVIRKLRSDARTKSIPVAVLSSSRSGEEDREGKALGVKAFITKPVYFSEFSVVMSQLGFRWLLTKHT